MIVKTMVDNVLGNPRGNDDRGDPWAVPLKGEAILIVSGSRSRVPWCNSCRRDDMVEEATVLIRCDDKHAAPPDLRVADGFVGRFDQPFAKSDIIEGMLRCAPLVIIKKVVARFNEYVVVGEWSLQVGCEMVILSDVIE